MDALLNMWYWIGVSCQVTRTCCRLESWWPLLCHCKHLWLPFPKFSWKTVHLPAYPQSLRENGNSNSKNHFFGCFQQGLEVRCSLRVDQGANRDSGNIVLLRSISASSYNANWEFGNLMPCRVKLTNSFYNPKQGSSFSRKFQAISKPTITAKLVAKINLKGLSFSQAYCYGQNFVFSECICWLGHRPFWGEGQTVFPTWEEWIYG